MSHSSKQLLRHAILLQLEAASPATLPSSTILQGCQLAGHKINEDLLSKELHYLSEKLLINSKSQPLSPGLIRFFLTAPGLEYLESQGLA